MVYIKIHCIDWATDMTRTVPTTKIQKFYFQVFVGEKLNGFAIPWHVWKLDHRIRINGAIDMTRTVPSTMTAFKLYNK